MIDTQEQADKYLHKVLKYTHKRLMRDSYNPVTETTDVIIAHGHQMYTTLEEYQAFQSLSQDEEYELILATHEKYNKQ